MSTYKNVTRNDVNVVAAKIESLAKELQSRLSGSGDILTIGSELVRNTSLLTFSLGELTATELGKSQVVPVSVTPVTKPTVAATPKRVQTNYHNKRDARGRFASV